MLLPLPKLPNTRVVPGVPMTQIILNALGIMHEDKHNRYLMDEALPVHSPSCTCPIPSLLPFLEAVFCSKPLSVIRHHCRISRHPSAVGVSTHSARYQGSPNCQACVVAVIATRQVSRKL